MTRYKKGVVPVPLFTFSGHQAEGFGMDWCPTMSGKKIILKSKWCHIVWGPVGMCLSVVADFTEG